MRARELRGSQRFTLALVVLVALVVLATVSGARMLLSWGDRSASCAVAGTYSDSLSANRLRLAEIDRLLTRYDLSQADQIWVQLERRKKASAAEVMAFDSMRVLRNAFEDSLPWSTRRQPDEAPPTYSLDNPFTQRERITRSLDALKRLGADAHKIEEFLDNELLTPVTSDSRQPRGSTSAVHAPGTSAAAHGPGAWRPLETLRGASGSTIDSRLEWHDTALVSQRLTGYRAICSANRRAMTRWSLLFFGSVLALVAGWWLVMHPGRARQAPR